MSSFVHLAAQSWYSQRHGLMNPQALCQYAAQSRMPALGVADRNGLAGMVQLAKAAQQAGITYIPGVDLALTPQPYPGWGPLRSDYHKTPRLGQPYHQIGKARITLLASSASAFGALCRITSVAHGVLDGVIVDVHDDRRRRAPEVNEADIVHHLAGQAGVWVLFGPESPLARLAARGHLDQASTEVRRWLTWFAPDQLLIGLHHRDLPQDDRPIARLCALGDMHGIKVVIDQRPRFIHPEDGALADLLDAHAQHMPLGSHHNPRRGQAGLWENERALIRRFRERPDALTHTLRVAEATEIDWRLGQPRLPHFGRWEDGDSQAAPRHLRHLASLGLIDRLGIDPSQDRNHEVVQRFEDELAVITQRGLAPYFLTVAAITESIRAKGILVSCRGSAAGSLITYALRISDVNPITYGLLMERFLHTYRTDLPDIDLDVESHRREEVQAMLIDTWGAHRVTGLAMVDTFRSRGAIRAVGEALGLGDGTINLVAKAFPRTLASRLLALADELPELQGLGLEEPVIRQLLTLAQGLDGLPRHLALHPCGLILADADLGAIAPFMPSGPRTIGADGPTFGPITMIPYDKDDIEDLGLVKLDVLGVRMFSALAASRDLAQGVMGQRIDFDAIDATHDGPTYDMIRRADTIGMFQIESPGQRELIGRIEPKDTHDLVIDISLFRPGPVKGNMIEPFLKGRKGDPVQTLPALIAPILEETHGVIVYHEQIIRLISAITGCDFGQADLARRNLAHPYALADLEHWITTWCARRQFPEAITTWLWTALQEFASFGFCKAHAAAFSVATYRSAWMKCQAMPAFLAGVLTHNPGMYPARLICAEARRHGIITLGVHINLSKAAYTLTTVEDPFGPDQLFPDGDHGKAEPGRRWAIRASLASVRGISAAQITSILAGQPFMSLEDLATRSRINQPVALDLAKIGAFDELEPTMSRGDILLAVEERWATRRTVLGAAMATRRTTTPTATPVTAMPAKATTGVGLGPLPQSPRPSPTHSQQGHHDPHGPHGPGCPQGLYGQTSWSTSKGSGDRLGYQPSTPLWSPADGGASVAHQLSLLPETGPPLGLPDFTPALQIRAEIEATGIDFSGHIIDWYAKKGYETHSSAELAALPEGQRVRVIGAKVATQTPPTSSGQRIIFLTLDDGKGLADITFFPRAHARCARTVFTNWLLIVEGRIQRRGTIPTIIGEYAWPLAKGAVSANLWHASPGSAG